MCLQLLYHKSQENSAVGSTHIDCRPPHGKIGIILRFQWAVGWSPEYTSVRRTKKLTGPRKLPGPWTTTWSKQYLSAVHPLTCNLLWVRYLFDPYPLQASSLGFWGQMTPEWKLFINFCSVQNLRFNHDSRVMAKFGENRPLQSCRKVISYCWQK